MTALSDVELGDWYSAAVAWAYDREITKGTTDDEFSPYALITREQMAKEQTLDSKNSSSLLTEDTMSEDLQNVIMFAEKSKNMQDVHNDLLKSHESSKDTQKQDKEDDTVLEVTTSNQGLVPVKQQILSNEAKMELLGVKEETLKEFGAVSEQTAYEMAVGAADFAKADVALSVTGIAGPGGGTPEKPVGLVYMGCFVNGKVTVRRHVFAGDRLQVRTSSVKKALELAKECILKY